MTATSFIDTNILLYAASNAPADQAKRQIARGLLGKADIGFSAQVLQEFYAAAIAKRHLQMTHDEAVAVLRRIHGRGTTIVMVEHLMRVVTGLADRIVVLDRGRKLADGPQHQVINDPEVRRAYLGRGDDAQR